MSKRNNKHRQNKQTKRNKKQSTAVRSGRRPGSSGPQQSLLQAVMRGAEHHNAGELSQAEAIYRSVLEKDSRQPDALHLLGVLAHQVGNNDRALELISKAIAAHPNFAAAYNNLGNVLQSLDRLEDAAASYRQAIVIKPNYDAAFNNLGNALLKLGQPEDAVACYRQALAANPHYVIAHNNLGNTLHELGRLEEAVESQLRAIEIDPKFVNAHRSIGELRHDQGRLDEAIASLEKVLAIDPNHAYAHSSLGTVYEKANLLDKAEIHIQKALELDPDFQAAIVEQSVLLRRSGKIQEAIEVLENLQTKTSPDKFTPKFCFELGKLYDRALDSELAYKWFSKGNDVQFRRKSSEIRPELFLKVVENIACRLTREHVESWLPDATASDVDSPVFLVGFPRSGTTLLDQILDSHPRLQVMEEKPVLDHLLSLIAVRPEGYPAALASFQEADSQELRAQYFQNVDQHIDRTPNTILVDKYPLNIRHTPVIVRLFPRAKIILALRHPCDVVLSNFMQLFELNSAMANFNTLENSARVYHRVMGLWLQCAELISMNVHTVKYEDLVTDLESEARRLLRFLDVEWTDTVLDFHTHAKQRGKINTPSYEQVSEPIYQRARYRWKRYEAQLQPVLEQLEPFIAAFGYESTDGDQ